MLADRIGSGPVQSGQAVRARQLARGHPGHQLAAGHLPLADVDRVDVRIQLPHDPEPVHQLIDRDQPRQPGQRPIRRADPDPPLALPQGLGKVDCAVT